MQKNSKISKTSQVKAQFFFRKHDFLHFLTRLYLSLCWTPHRQIITKLNQKFKVKDLWQQEVYTTNTTITTATTDSTDTADTTDAADTIDTTDTIDATDVTDTLDASDTTDNT